MGMRQNWVEPILGKMLASVAHQVINFWPIPNKPQFPVQKAQNPAVISFVSHHCICPGTHQNANPKSGVEKEHQGYLACGCLTQLQGHPLSKWLITILIFYSIYRWDNPLRGCTNQTLSGLDQTCPKAKNNIEHDLAFMQEALQDRLELLPGMLMGWQAETLPAWGCARLGVIEGIGSPVFRCCTGPMLSL